MIAQAPLAARDASRLLILNRRELRIEEQPFRDLPQALRAGDCLVLNDTRVSPVRLLGRIGGKSSEILIVRPSERSVTEWDVDAMVYPGRAFKTGAEFLSGDPPVIAGDVTGQSDAGRRMKLRSVDGHTPLKDLIERFGRVPLPPYITNPDVDPARYQTCFARDEGSVAAPTAGLHFTSEIFDALSRRGVRTAYVTLHVGPGTFRPVGEREFASGRLHEEPYNLPEETAETIRTARAAGGRTVAVGTTVCRTLEWIAGKYGEIRPDAGETNLFIREGYEFRVVDALLTNFHLPRTSLLMLVCAFAGREYVMSAYREAIERRFRFYSFGDAMLIL